MRVGVCLAVAGLLLSGCASSVPTGKEVLASGLAEKKPAEKKEAAHSNDNCVTAWEHNAYYYACDPNANY